MASFQLFFSPASISAFVSQINPHIEEFNILQARLLGRADDLEGSFDSAATHFTDIIAWDIKEQGSENYQLWVDTAVSLEYAADVTSQWVDYVQHFWDTRNEIWDEWDEAVSSAISRVPAEYAEATITASYPEREGFFSSLGGSDANKCRDLYDELRDKLEGFNERARNNLEKYEERAEEIREMLEQGATDVNVQKLIDAGHSSWGYQNLDPNKYLELESDFELTAESGEEIAIEIGPYWSGEKPLDDRYYELMLVISMIGTNARNTQNDGRELDQNELDFLRAFYEELENTRNPNPGNNSMGILEIPETMDTGGLSEEEVEYALGILGGGLLALSDEKIGGGYEELPESIQSVIEGPDFSNVRSQGGYRDVHNAWREGAESLNRLLEHSDGKIEGGSEFSTRMMHSISGELNRMQLTGGDDSSMSGLLDVATRNEDANYAILTGEYPDGVEGGLPWNDKSQENITSNIIENIYKHEWSDDGEAARGLTRWIEETAFSDDKDERTMAAEAMDALMETITTKEMHDALSDTGVTVEISDGTEVSNAPFTAVNGEIADGFAHLFELYINSFSSDFGIEEGKPKFDLEREAEEKEEGGEEEESNENPWDDTSMQLKMLPRERLIFLEYVMGNEDSAIRAHRASGVYTTAQIEYFLEEGSPSQGGNPAGIVQSLVDSALHNEAVNRNLDSDQEEAMKRRIFEGVANTGNNALGQVPGLGVALQSAGQFIATDFINEAFKEYSSSKSYVDSSTTKVGVEFYTNARVLSEVMDRNNGEIPTPEGDIKIGNDGKSPEDILRDSGLVAETNGVLSVDINADPAKEEGAPSSSEIRDALKFTLESAEIDWLERTPVEAYTFSNEFSEEYFKFYEPMENAMRYSKSNINLLYEGDPANSSNA
ncbi:hypothetical protein [Nocardiopsis alba]|uniref:TPR repeat region-containing protein n=1 Tax=Nocardiopsis alba TaxID=53437 RepID=UPI0033B4D2AC